MFSFTRIALKLKLPFRKVSRNIYRNKLLILFCNQREASDADCMFEKNFLISDHPPLVPGLPKTESIFHTDRSRIPERGREREGERILREYTNIKQEKQQ